MYLFYFNPKGPKMNRYVLMMTLIRKTDNPFH